MFSTAAGASFWGAGVSGVGACAGAAGCSADAFAPHTGQNLAPGFKAAPQAVQVLPPSGVASASTLAPQEGQNFALSFNNVAHFLHLIVANPPF